MFVQTCGRNKDHRTFESYAQDLVASWLYEDTLLFYMQKYGLRVNLNGADQGREILKSEKISTGADYFVTQDKWNP